MSRKERAYITKVHKWLIGQNVTLDDYIDELDEGTNEDLSSLKDHAMVELMANLQKSSSALLEAVDTLLKQE